MSLWGRTEAMLAVASVSPAIILAAVFGFLLGWTGAAVAQEARCAALAADCLCSEPLTNGTFTNTGNSTFGLDDGRATKKCGNVNGVPLGFIEHGSASDFALSTDPTIISRFPSGNTVTRVFKTTDPLVAGIFNVWHNVPGSPAYSGTLAMRVYMFVSANFKYSTDGCDGNSGKMVIWAVSQSPYVSVSGNSWSTNWGTTTVWSGMTAAARSHDFTPPPHHGALMQSTYTPAFVKGRWVWWELQIRNDGGTPVVLKAYFKDVTGGGPVVTYADTSTADTSVGWDSTSANGLQHTFDCCQHLAVEMFRTGSAAACPGYFALSHLMYAKSASDPGGPLIGSAVEIEGGTAGTTSSPSVGLTALTGVPPSRVHGTVMTPRPSIRSALVLVVLGGAVILIRRHRRRARGAR